MLFHQDTQLLCGMSLSSSFQPKSTCSNQSPVSSTETAPQPCSPFGLLCKEGKRSKCSNSTIPVLELSHRVPLKICMKPTVMIRAKAKSFPAVNISWMRVAHRTLELFTQVRSTGEQKTEFSEMKLYSFKNTHSTIKHWLLHSSRVAIIEDKRGLALPYEVPSCRGASIIALLLGALLPGLSSLKGCACSELNLLPELGFQPPYGTQRMSSFPMALLQSHQLCK